jgi:integrase
MTRSRTDKVRKDNDSHQLDNFFRRNGVRLLDPEILDYEFSASSSLTPYLLRFHDLRHTYATLLLMHGESPAYVSKQLGHSSIKITVDVYCHWLPNADRAAVNRLPVPGSVPKAASLAN